MSENEIINLIFKKEDMTLCLLVDINRPFCEVADLVLKKFAINKMSEEPYFIYTSDSLDINSTQTIKSYKFKNNSSVQVVIGAELNGGKN